jgi:hypothetical protein
MKTTENIRRHIGETLTIRWGTSRGVNTYGYTTCSLRNQRGERVAACNGGGYDMRGTVLGNWIAATFPKELCALRSDGKRIDDGRSFYGLRFYDPNYDPGKAVVGKDCSDRTLVKPDESSEGKTVEQVEAEGVSFGLERLQAFYGATAPHSTERHTRPTIDGACGESSVMEILRASG